MGNPGPIIRFGEFELDTRSAELSRQGRKVSLQEQPFRALLLLMERPGELVTREELTKKLWPGNTFVDFERGLNKTINKIRAALTDEADRPRYIETLPLRGYRFIALVGDGTPLPNQPQPQRVPKIDSLAVLPLENLSGDPAQEYFADGMTEELICALVRIASLRVISRTSVMTYKGARKPLPSIAKELRVDAVVQGSVLRAGDKVRITAQLIYAPEDRHLWSARYERDLRGILELQAEIAQDVAHQIHKLVDPETVSPGPARQVHPQAYEACLKGNFFQAKNCPADLERSIAFYNQAIELDPAYAQAYGDLSHSYFFCGVFGMGLPREIFAKARLNATKALELDERVTSARNALAATHIIYEWDWAAAESESRRAVALDPRQSVTHAHLGDYLSIMGRHGEAIGEFRQVLDLDPISREYHTWLALILYRARRYDESIAEARIALDLDPYYTNALWFLALSLEQNGNLRGAIASLEQAVSVAGAPHYRALLGRASALAGDKMKARQILDELKAVSERRYVSPFDFAVVYQGLGDPASTFHWLEVAYEQRVYRIIEITLALFDSLASDPRMRDLVGRIGLSETVLPYAGRACESRAHQADTGGKSDQR